MASAKNGTTLILSLFYSCMLWLTICVGVTGEEIKYKCEKGKCKGVCMARCLLRYDPQKILFVSISICVFSCLLQLFMMKLYRRNRTIQWCPQSNVRFSALVPIFRIWAWRWLKLGARFICFTDKPFSTFSMQYAAQKIEPKLGERNQSLKLWNNEIDLCIWE